LPDRVELAIGGGGAPVALPEPSQQVPGRVAVQQFLVVRAGVLADGLADQRSIRASCSSRAGSAAVATRTARRCSMGLPGVRSSSAAWLSGRCPAASSASTVRVAARLSQFSTVSGRPALARVSCSSRSSGRTCPPGPASSSPSWRRSWQRRQIPASRRPLAPQAAQAFQKPGSGTAQLAHNGAWRVPARMAASCPQREHSACQRAHARHHG
jgi:hypothetical protein